MCMYQIGDKALDNKGRIFTVEGIQMKDFGTGENPYLVLKPCFRYDFTPEYRFFVPQDKADTILHKILEKNEALALIDSLPGLETYPELGPRERKLQFQTVVATCERINICRVIKTLTAYREKRKQNNKPFSDFDSRLLSSLRSMFENEMSIALELDPSEVNDFIQKRTGETLF